MNIVVALPLSFVPFQNGLTSETKWKQVQVQVPSKRTLGCNNKSVTMNIGPPKQAKACSNCHQTGHQKRYCKNLTCPGISQCNLKCKHSEINAKIAEQQGLIKDLEKRSEKSKSKFLNFKAAREKASNSFFAIMRPRLRKSNAMKYTGTDRLILDRDLMTLKKALNHKILCRKRLVLAVDN